MKKKMIVLSFILLGLLATGCTKKVNYEGIMETYAKKYYESYMKGVEGQDKNDVSIKQLKTINEKIGDTYDLSKLKACKESSYTTVVSDKNRNIKKYEHHLNCK
ncbi:MAG: hypothetical protein PHN72_01855 [Bacilli bacterium]|nr:hypothetical protein [Bacilli bacterium]